MKIAFFEIEDWEKTILKKALKEHTLSFLKEPLTTKNVSEIRDFDIVSVFIYSKITKEIKRKLPKLKMIATRSTGYDHIKVKTIVCNVPFYGENTVAEMAFALILMISRKLYPAYLRSKDLKFNHDELMGFDLKDKTLGVVGMGHIGEYSARYGVGFGMKVLAYDPFPNEELAKEIGFKYAKDLDDMLKQADVITLHAPYNKHTHHLINMDNVKLIKPGAILVNTARGGLVDTEALIYALDNGILSGAGLDVIEGEPEMKEEWEVIAREYKEDQLKDIIMNHILIEREDVIVTPHNAFNTREAINRILETTQENICGFIKGEPLNVVKPR